jgi:hypothetical protein
MKKISYFFFYTYIGLVIVAGAWGAFINPTWDFAFLFGFFIEDLYDSERINILSQYRFLRAIELGFGIFSIMFFKEIFSEIKFNRLFLVIMGLGILARTVSWIVDGNPNLLTKFFLFYEALGWILISIYSKTSISQNEG